jgi:hypothetical protein
MNEIELIAKVSSDPASPAALGLAVYLLTALAKRIAPERLKADWLRRAVSLVIAFAPGLALTLSEHMAWNAALRTAVLSWAVSQLVFFLSKDKASPPNVGPALAIVFYISLGCNAHQAEQVRTAVEASRDVAAIAEPCLVALKEKQLSDCAGDAACEAEVRRWYSPVADAFDSFRRAWCTLAPQSEGCQ